MNNERFAELLNLYLDDEISPEDLSDLMAETRQSSDRQKVFIDYCRIHKACSQLGDPFKASARKRSFKQVAYALGGLAAAFALLGMAGRNLLPLFNGPAAKPAVVQNSLSKGATVFFPEVNSSELASNQFFRVNSQTEYVGVSSFGTLKDRELSRWNDRLILSRSQEEFGIKSETLFTEELLELGAISLQDPFNTFDELNGSIPFDFSRAAFAPDVDFELSPARNSRLNLK